MPARPMNEFVPVPPRSFAIPDGFGDELARAVADINAGFTTLRRAMIAAESTAHAIHALEMYGKRV